MGLKFSTIPLKMGKKGQTIRIKLDSKEE